MVMIVSGSNPVVTGSFFLKATEIIFAYCMQFKINFVSKEMRLKD